MSQNKDTSERIRILTICFAFIHLSCYSVLAQPTLTTSEDSVSVDKLLSGLSLDFGNAPVYFDQIATYQLTPFQHLAFRKYQSWYLYDIGAIDSSMVVIKSAIDSAMEIRSNQPEWFTVEIAKCFKHLRTIYLRKGTFSECLHIDTTALNLVRDLISEEALREYGGAMLNLSIDYWRLKKFDSSLEMLKKLEKQLDLFPNPRIRIRTYMMFGLVYGDLNSISDSREYHLLALEYLERNKNENIRDLMATYINLSDVYSDQGNYDSAMICLNKGEQVLTEEQMSSPYAPLIPYYLSEIHSSRGVIYFRLSDFESAVADFSACINIQTENYGESYQKLAASFTRLASSQIQAGHLKKAELSLIKAERVAQENQMDFWEIYNTYGMLHEKKGNLNDAIAYYDSAERANRISEATYRNQREYLVSVKGILSASILDDQSELSMLKARYEELKSYAANQFAGTEDPLLTGLFLDVTSMLYAEFLKMDKATQVKYLPEIQQLSRAFRLRSQLRHRYLLNYALPDSLIAYERDLQDRIESSIAEYKPNALDSSLIALKLEYREFVTQVERQYPDYFNLKFNNRFATLKEIQSGVDQEESIVSYLEGENEVFQIVITSDAFKTKVIDRAELYGLIDTFGKAILDADMNLLAETSKAIGVLLDVKQSFRTRKVTVIPDGKLWQLNFNALLEDSSEGEIAFLGNRVHLSFDYFFNSTSKPQNTGSFPQVLAISYNASRNSDGEAGSYLRFGDFEQDLPGTSMEVASVAGLVDGEYYFGNQATETVFKSASSNHSVLHLAVHGIEDPHFPENSYLKFAGNDSLNDGKLYAFELYNLSLESDLAILSACRSGNGKLASGEGMMSLSRAFTYAGTRSVLASRWEVPDATAPYLMSYFYEGLKEGMKKSESLTYAQNQFLKNDADNLTAAPYYWAGFYVIGDDSPVDLANRSKYRYLWMAALAGLVSAFLVRRYYSRRSSNS